MVGRYFLVFTIRLRMVRNPLYGRRNPDTAALVAQDNPIEMLDAYDVRDGEFNLYVAYAGRDNFNLDAQAESFLYRAGQRGIHVDVDYLPNGRHDKATVLRHVAAALDWLGDRLRPCCRSEGRPPYTDGAVPEAQGSVQSCSCARCDGRTARRWWGCWTAAGCVG